MGVHDAAARHARETDVRHRRQRQSRRPSPGARSAPRRGPAPWFVPTAATPRPARRSAASAAETPPIVSASSPKVIIATIGRSETERTASIAVTSSSRSKNVSTDEQVDAAPGQQPGLLREERCAVLGPRLLVLPERPDRAGDEDLPSGDLARVTGELHGRLVDPDELFLEVARGQLRAVRAECVRLDQLGAGVDEADVEGDDRLRSADVGLLRAAQARRGGRDQRPGAAVRDDRRPVPKALEEPGNHPEDSSGPVRLHDVQRVDSGYCGRERQSPPPAAAGNPAEATASRLDAGPAFAERARSRQWPARTPAAPTVPDR